MNRTMVIQNNTIKIYELDCHCRYNELKKLQKDIGDLCQLKKLDLHRYRLNKLPIEFGNFTQLTELDLSWNPLNFLPKEIGNLTQL